MCKFKIGNIILHKTIKTEEKFIIININEIGYTVKSIFNKQIYEPVQCTFKLVDRDYKLSFSDILKKL